MSKLDIICDRSNSKLRYLPDDILEMTNLKMLYLDSNMIEFLPEEFFHKLPHLTWLDLRNNKLQYLPNSIAYHLNLENLLLSNNEIEELPVGLGMLPCLQVLQISGNPIRSPPASIIEKGIPEVCKYLRALYLQSNPAEEPSKKSNEEEAENKPQQKKARKTMSVRELLRKSSQASAALRKGMMPSISVKSLSNMKDETASIKSERPTRKCHKILKGASKISLRSHANSQKYVAVSKINTGDNDKRIEAQELKDAWVAKLKELLSDQEKILQQEKNLKALNGWRLSKKMERPRSSTMECIVEAPYDTDPNYDTMLSREEMVGNVDRMVKFKKEPAKKVDIQQMLNEFASQLKALELKAEDKQSPRTEIDNAGRQIQMILDLHKKISQAQIINSKI